MYFVFVGLDYFGVGFEYVWLKDCGWVKYVVINDDEVLVVFCSLIWIEGIMFVLEFSYVVVYVEKLVVIMLIDEIVIVNLLG